MLFERPVPPVSQVKPAVSAVVIDYGHRGSSSKFKFGGNPENFFQNLVTTNVIKPIPSLPFSRLVKRSSDDQLLYDFQVFIPNQKLDLRPENEADLQSNRVQSYQGKNSINNQELELSSFEKGFKL